MTEQEFIAKEDAKYKEGIKKHLRRMKEYGFLRSRNATATLLLAGFVVFSPPCDGFQYNHYKLTAEGEAYLAS